MEKRHEIVETSFELALMIIEYAELLEENEKYIIDERTLPYLKIIE